MAGIRVNTGEKRVEVNDNGDYIVLNFGDASFPKRFVAMCSNAQKRSSEALEAAKKIAEQHGENSEAYAEGAANEFEAACSDIAEYINGLFGEGSCKKIFGDIVPSMICYMDFLEQLKPIFEDAVKEQNKRLNKYSAARTGNV